MTEVGMIVIGVIALVVGAILTLGGIEGLRRRQRILTTPTSPIAEATGKGRIAIKGRIAPSEQGLFNTPFSGRVAVWARYVVQEERIAGNNSRYWATLLSEIEQRTFLVDDASGQLARVTPEGANVILEAMPVGGTGLLGAPTPQLEAFLDARAASGTPRLATREGLRYLEEILAPGDAVYALGPSRRDPGPPVSDGYRVVPSSQLVLFAAPGAAGESILSNKTEAQLVSKLAQRFLLGLVLVGMGLVALVAGVHALVTP